MITSSISGENIYDNTINTCTIIFVEYNTKFILNVFIVVNIFVFKFIKCNTIKCLIQENYIFEILMEEIKIKTVLPS